MPAFPSVLASALLAATLIACGGAATAPRSAGPTASPTATAAPGESRLAGNVDLERKRLVDDPVADAADAVQRGDLDAAVAILRRVVADVPAGWRPIRQTGDGVEVAAWTFEDLLPYAGGDTPPATVTWTAPSYSRAYFLLGFIAIERGDLPAATMLLDASLALEPHPDALTERALVAQHAKTLDLALDLYIRASTSDRSSALQRARAWRGRGSVLIDMNRLDDAEAAYRTSLELQPDHHLALAQLDYIAKRRAGEEQARDPIITK